MKSSVKDQWIQTIMGLLFQHELKRIGELVEKLNYLNCVEKNTVAHGFMYQGVRYVAPSCIGVYKKNLPNLAFTLSDEAAQFISEKNKIDTDMIHIRQALIALVTQCTTMQELRDSLPDCIVQLTSLKSLPRTIQDNTYLIRSNKYQLEEYNRILPKIQMYSVSQLLY